MSDELIADRLNARLLLILKFVGFIVACGFIRRNNPKDSKILMPKCPTKFVAGVECPACGGLRFAHDVLNFRFVEAFRDNPFLALSAPYVLVEIARYLKFFPEIDSETRERDHYRLLMAAIIWTALRNLKSSGLPEN